MNYIDCPKCGMKYHQKAITCPKCKVTPEQHQINLVEDKKKQAIKDKAAAIRERSSLTFCTVCGSTFKRSKTVTKGSIFLEIFLWLMILVPGLIYSIWRHTSRYSACPICNAKDIIPANSPKAEQILGKI